MIFSAKFFRFITPVFHYLALNKFQLPPTTSTKIEKPGHHFLVVGLVSSRVAYLVNIFILYGIFGLFQSEFPLFSFQYQPMPLSLFHFVHH